MTPASNLLPIRPAADAAPPPIAETNLRSIVIDIAETFSMAVALIRDDGELVAAAGSVIPEVPTPVELAGEVYGSRQPRWYNPEGKEIVRLIVPVFSRRLVWGYLIASYRYLGPTCENNGHSKGDGALYTLAAAPNLLRAIGNALNSAILIRQQLDDLDDLSCKMLQSYEEISLLYRLGQHCNVTMRPAEVLEFTCRELQKVLGQYRSVACMATQPSSPNDHDGPVNSSAGPVKISKDDVAGLFHWYREQPLSWGQPYIENGAHAHRHELPSGLFERLLMVPVCYQSEMLGLLVSASSMDAVEFDSRDAQLVANLATQIGAHWKNFLLFDELRQLLFALVRALVSAIDAKDPYTCGHSERVAMVARRLAAAAALDADSVEEIYLSGLLHDIGKIGIREEVLLKPSKLTAEEWEHLRQHPDIGARILQPVSAIAKVVPGVQFHHECYNGKGYPRGLAGRDIPLMARIIAVADAFDAMSTDRPYRKALSLSEIRSVFVGGAGQQWDQEFVDIFVDLLDDEEFIGRYCTLRQNHHLS